MKVGERIIENADPLTLQSLKLIKVMFKGVKKMNVAKNLEYMEEKSMDSVISVKQNDKDEMPKSRKDSFENFSKYFPIIIKKTVREQLERGTPIAYCDDEGRVLVRYPDRRICVVKMNMKTYEKTETFLRMATPEDDIGLYD